MGYVLNNMKAAGHIFYCFALFILLVLIIAAYGYIAEVDERHISANMKLMNMLDDEQVREMLR